MRIKAPGKVVLWGEYAVFTGAPAAVMAVNRYATVDFQKQPRGWGFQAAGFMTPGLHAATADFVAAPVTALVNTAMQFFGHTDYTRPFSYYADTADYYQSGQKLGLGSSAAVCVATCQGLGALFDHQVTMVDAMQIHRLFQGGSGSGLDVATSWLGGVIRFQDQQATPSKLPADWSWQIIFSGQSASTRDFISHFSQWREANQNGPLNDLGVLSESMCDVPALATLEQYIECLAELDTAAKLNIFTQEHQRLATIASETGVVYKPCGAGGGDIGIALSDNPEKLTEFNHKAASENFTLVQTEIATHGVQIDQ